MTTEVQPGGCGWAPGGYLIHCIDCGGDGGPEYCDKRAVRCKKCAQIAKDKTTEVQPGEFGWIPGNDVIRCVDCRDDGRMHNGYSPGCDKRAVRCKECAQKMKDAARDKPPKPSDSPLDLPAAQMILSSFADSVDDNGASVTSAEGTMLALAIRRVLKC